MTTKRTGTRSQNGSEMSITASPEELLHAARERGGDSMETGRYVITYRPSAAEEGMRQLKAQGTRVADARDYKEQAVAIESAGDADALVLPELGVALVSGPVLEQHSLAALDVHAADSPIEVVEPEYFVFPSQRGYLRGFMRAAEIIAKDLELEPDDHPEPGREELDVQALGATWGLVRCKVPPSTRSGLGIKVAVLDTGMDLLHPDFAGRSFVTQSFVGEPVQDGNGHGTHCIGTACGPAQPPGTTPRYGIAHGATIYAGKVLSNAGTGATGSVLAGINWAIANGCQVISMSLGSQSPVQTAYTAAGRAALDRGCLIIAAAGNEGKDTGAPASSPTIMSVAALDMNLRPSSFSNSGKIEIAAPGRDVYSSVPMPVRYGYKSGTSMATPHVAGCAALWAQTSSTLRGMKLWRRLQASASKLSLATTRAGSGLVQAP
jgi:subtilisin